MGTINILSPVIGAKGQEEPVSDLRLESLSGKVVGFLSNKWPSLSIVWPRLQELLRAKCGVADTVLIEGAGEADSRAMAESRAMNVNKIIEKCDAAIVGLGN